MKVISLDNIPRWNNAGWQASMDINKEITKYCNEKFGPNTWNFLPNGPFGSLAYRISFKDDADAIVFLLGFK